MLKEEEKFQLSSSNISSTTTRLANVATIAHQHGYWIYYTWIFFARVHWTFSIISMSHTNKVYYLCLLLNILWETTCSYIKYIVNFFVIMYFILTMISIIKRDEIMCKEIKKKYTFKW